jgi:hypothetical protein
MFGLILLIQCTPPVLPQEQKVDTLLTEKQITDILTKYEWRLHLLYGVDLSLPSITSRYDSIYSNPAIIVKFANDRTYFSKTTGIFSPLIRGSWKLTLSDTLRLFNSQPRTYYHKPIQGIMSLDKGIANLESNTVLPRELGLVIVSDQEFFITIGGSNSLAIYFFKPNL